MWKSWGGIGSYFFIAHITTCENLFGVHGSIAWAFIVTLDQSNVSKSYIFKKSQSCKNLVETLGCGFLKSSNCWLSGVQHCHRLDLYFFTSFFFLLWTLLDLQSQPPLAKGMYFPSSLALHSSCSTNPFSFFITSFRINKKLYSRNSTFFFNMLEGSFSLYQGKLLCCWIWTAYVKQKSTENKCVYLEIAKGSLGF